jgi:hypothetical protein
MEPAIPGGVPDPGMPSPLRLVGPMGGTNGLGKLRKNGTNRQVLGIFRGSCSINFSRW